jgi:membrane protease subunit HflC
MKQTVIGVFVVFAALWVLIPQALFTLDEREQAIITQLGAYIRTITDPGLHAKIPFVQTVHRFDKRVLATDADPAEYLTLDKKRLVVDYVARWQIKDPLAFFISVATLEGARARIEDIVFSELRQAISSQDFAPVTSELREPTMDAVANAARARTQAFGIELIDVRIKPRPISSGRSSWRKHMSAAKSYRVKGMLRQPPFTPVLTGKIRGSISSYAPWRPTTTF